MTRIYYDTEFIEDGHTIVLISIGMITDDGRSYYAVNGDLEDKTHPTDNVTTWERIVKHDWLVRNVVPHLPIHGRKTLEKYLAGGTIFSPNPTMFGVRPDYSNTDVKPRQVIANEVRDFIQAAGPDVELWAWYGAYDHVALCWLWGRMIDLPDGVPMYTNDLRQERRRLGDPEMPRQADGEHNALADAVHNRDMARFLDQYAELHTDGPVRFASSGWEVSLDTSVDAPPYAEFKRQGVRIAAGYMHPDPHPLNVATAPGMVVTELLPDGVDDDSE